MQPASTVSAAGHTSHFSQQQVDLVRTLTTDGGPYFVKPEERIAVF